MFSEFSSENRAVYKVMCENMVERDRHRLQYNTALVLACWIIKATNTHSELCNIYCFSTVTMVPQTRLGVLLYVHCLSCYLMYLTYKCARGHWVGNSWPKIIT